MDDQAQVPAVASMAKDGCALVNYGSVCSARGHCIGYGLDAFDALDGTDA